MIRPYYSFVLCFTLTAGFGCLIYPGYAMAYVGPGAGIVLAGSYLPALAGIVAAMLLLLIWPVRLYIKAKATKKALKMSGVKKCVIIGLDGFDPELTQDFMDRGLLPNFQRLAVKGCHKRLSTTIPALSPVAWSSFQTGTNPGKHGVFDFLARGKSSYTPVMSTVRTGVQGKHYRLGKIRIPISPAPQRLLRKSKPFWEILGENKIYSQIIRVPVTFPPEKFNGALLSGAYVPDIRGSQGIFSYYHTGVQDLEEVAGGEIHQVEMIDSTVHGVLTGPSNPFEDHGQDLNARFSVSLLANGRMQLKIGKKQIALEQGKYSPWVKVRFKAAPGILLHGICKFLVISIEPEFAMYATPVQLDPAHPSMPISQPRSFAPYLARKTGSYATLGMAEDTWALEENILDQQAFLDQCLSVEKEREKMFMHALKSTRQGLVACVFDSPDRIQHCFWQDHEACASQDEKGLDNPIRDTYVRMDNMVGRVLDQCQDKKTVVMVLSDHGFAPFHHGVELNRWLEQNGYLKLVDNPQSNRNLKAIDWNNTRAYALGLAGISLNIKGREPLGIVEPDQEAELLAREIADKLAGLCMPEDQTPAITNVYLASDIYRGPYANEGPDLIVGYERGFRASWDTAKGVVGKEIFQENKRAWSGDHCVDPQWVPGVFFCNRLLDREAPHIMDIAPTVLRMFGVSIPPYMEGSALKTVKPNRDLVAWQSSTPA